MPHRVVYLDLLGKPLLDRGLEAEVSGPRVRPGDERELVVAEAPVRGRGHDAMHRGGRQGGQDVEDVALVDDPGFTFNAHPTSGRSSAFRTARATARPMARGTPLAIICRAASRRNGMCSRNLAGNPCNAQAS